MNNNELYYLLFYVFTYFREKRIYNILRTKKREENPYNLYESNNSNI